MEEKKYKIGFIQGVFDLFHVGHLNLLKKAKQNCETLIVGVNSDELVQEYKNKTPMINYDERAEIVKAIKYVDEVVQMNDRDKIVAAKKYGFDVLFMGDDWKGTDFYNQMEEELKKEGVDIVYFPYTKSISSTIIRDKLLKIVLEVTEESDQGKAGQKVKQVPNWMKEKKDENSNDRT